MADDEAILGYCIEVLTGRIRQDPEGAWLWRIKRDVAVYVLRSLERTFSNVDGARTLTDSEREEILRTHPLLQNQRHLATSPPRHEESDWYREIRRKVQQYMVRQHPGGQDAQREAEN